MYISALFDYSGAITWTKILALFLMLFLSQFIACANCKDSGKTTFAQACLNHQCSHMFEVSFLVVATQIDYLSKKDFFNSQNLVFLIFV